MDKAEQVFEKIAISTGLVEKALTSRAKRLLNAGSSLSGDALAMRTLKQVGHMEPDFKGTAIISAIADVNHPNAITRFNTGRAYPNITTNTVKNIGR